MKKYLWFWLLALVLLLRVLLSAQQVEVAYSRTLFPLIRLLQGWLSALSPVALIYILLLVLVGALIGRIKRKGRKGLLWAILSTLFLLAFSFLVLWGLHYQREPFEKTIGLDTHPLDEQALEAEYLWATQQILESRNLLGIPMDEAISEFYSFRDLEKHLFPRVRSVVEGWGYPTLGKVRARKLYPKGILLRFSSSGVYLPWTGEGHIDAGLHPLNWPFVMSHELSHGYGMANEGVCNFLAYQVCSSDPDPYIRYAGMLYYWRYTAYEMQRFCPHELDESMQALPEGIRKDLADIRRYSMRYPDFIPQWRDVVYDSFLKSQGLHEGILSYEKVLVLAHAYRKELAISN